MTSAQRTDTFYDAIPVFTGFASLMDPALYQRLPDDWWIGLSDIVSSTAAIASSRYKAVNMAGAATIAAVTNALDGRGFPFVFGGDGATFAVAPGDCDAAREALATTARWVSDELNLTMRVAMIPLAAIRDAGLDVRVARFAPSPNVSYAMFTGGGVGWAETAMKRGAFAIEPAPPGSAPDLSGLSCRFDEMPARRGVILSVLVVRNPSADMAAFREAIEQIVKLVEASPEAGRPVPAGGPAFHWPPTGLDYEARATRGGPLLLRRLKTATVSLFGYVLLRFGIPAGAFVPDVYLSQLVANSDFRKYDDGLRMVLDCTPDLAAVLEQKLAAAALAGVIKYGLHSQTAALLTCFTPAATRSDHVHFVDGAGGGYAMAARALKASASDAGPGLAAAKSH